jgi:hypothetical protein
MPYLFKRERSLETLIAFVAYVAEQFSSQDDRGCGQAERWRRLSPSLIEIVRCDIRDKRD